MPLLLLALWRVGQWKLKRYHSPLLGTIEVLKKYNGEKMLTINTYLQGVSTNKKSIKDSYWYRAAQETVNFCQGRKNPQVLMLGLGSNTISDLIGKKDNKIRQTIIEVDKYIIAACREYFDLDKLPNCQLIQADAYKLAENPRAFGRQFDVIIVDIYTGKPPYVSLESNQPNFIEKILPWLKKDGMILFNRPGHNPEAREDSAELEEYLQTLFQKTELLLIEDPRKIKNNLILGFTKKK